MNLSKPINLTGREFGRLRVIEIGERPGIKWKCDCSCGVKGFFVRGDHLRGGHTVSCGCYNRERTLPSTRTHGRSVSRVYWAYRNLLRYHRAVKLRQVCDRWVVSFQNFLADMGEPPSDNHFIHRKDTAMEFCKENCVWDEGVQCLGRRRPIRGSASFA